MEDKDDRTDPGAIASRIEQLTADFDVAVQDQLDNPSSLAATYVRVREAEDILGAAMKALGRLSDALQYAKLPEAFQTAGVTSLTVIGHRVTAMPLVRASIANGHRDEAYQWLRDQEYGNLIIETVNASSLAGLVRSLAQDEGKELPDALFNVHHGTTMSVTRVK